MLKDGEDDDVKSRSLRSQRVFFCSSILKTFTFDV